MRSSLQFADKLLFKCRKLPLRNNYYLGTISEAVVLCMALILILLNRVNQPLHLDETLLLYKSPLHQLQIKKSNKSLLIPTLFGSAIRISWIETTEFSIFRRQSLNQRPIGFFFQKNVDPLFHAFESLSILTRG